MKIYLTILISFLLLPVFAFAERGDLLMGGSAVISTTAGNFILSGDASTLDSITVNSGNFSVIMSYGTELLITSADRKDFTISPSGYAAAVKEFICGTSVSTLRLGNPLWSSAITYTVTPSSGACSVSGGGSSPSSTGGGGGGGGGGYAPTVPPQTQTGSAVAAVTPSASAAPTTVSAGGISAVFSATMKAGMSSADVKRLQQVLNSNPDTQIASSGVGSPGHETEYFGSLTRAAVKKFQAKYGLASSGDENSTGYGLVGPKTRAKLQEVFSVQGGQAASATSATQAALEAQIQSLLQQLNDLQAQLNAMQ